MDGKAQHLRLRIGAQGDGLLEMTWIAALAIVGYIHFAALARQYRFGGVFRHGAATRGHGLVDDERGIAHVGELEHIGHYGICLGKGAEVVDCNILMRK